jgi:hypothetical protein
VIGEVEERPQRSELLTLEQHRRPRRQQQQRGHRAQPPRRRERGQARAVHRVGDLIVILEIQHEGRGG